MTNETPHSSEDVHTEATVEPTTQVRVERVYEVEPPPPRSRIGPFIAGFVTAAVAAVIGVVAFLAVSDTDDDGNLELDVPAVDVDVDG